MTIFRGRRKNYATNLTQMAGDSLYLDWFPQWLLDLAQRHFAVILSPNYRFLPEATSLDILDDIEDFWTWLHSSELADLLSSGPAPTQLDLSRIITAGDSAGGLLSILLALSHPDEIRAATAAYPMLDLRSPHYSTATDKTVFSGAPRYPASMVTEHLEKMRPEDAASPAFPPARFPLLMATFQYGRVLEFYERGSENSPRRGLLFPIERLESEGAKLPRGGVSIIHGVSDCVVPVEGSKNFVEKAREVMKGKQGGDKVVLALQEGDHGFDAGAKLDDEWLRDALKAAVEVWLE